MTDEELVKQFRDIGDHAGYEPSIHHTAADVIERLRERAAAWRTRAEQLHAVHSKPKFRYGDRARKISGSSWQGRVCGTYQTSLTPEGYAVESEREPGSVQIYPAAALEKVDDRR